MLSHKITPVITIISFRALESSSDPKSQGLPRLYPPSNNGSRSEYSIELSLRDILLCLNLYEAITLLTEGLIPLLNVLSILLYSNFNPLIPIISYI